MDSQNDEIVNLLAVSQENFRYALNGSGASALHEIIVEEPRTTWEDIEGLENVKGELKEFIQYSEEVWRTFPKFATTLSHGVHFYGPPGCGKFVYLFQMIS
jgi:transitional endoplasmic reticulum ATPase